MLLNSAENTELRKEKKNRCLFVIFCIDPVSWDPTSVWHQHQSENEFTVTAYSTYFGFTNIFVKFSISDTASVCNFLKHIMARSESIKLFNFFSHFQRIRLNCSVVWECLPREEKRERENEMKKTESGYTCSRLSRYLAWKMVYILLFYLKCKCVILPK